MNKNLPFIGVLLSNGQVESYSELEAEEQGWHHSALFSDKGIQEFDNDSALRFIRYNSDDIITLEGGPSLDPFNSGWDSISKLCQYLINKGMNSNTPVEIAQQHMGSEFEGKGIGVLNDFIGIKKENRQKRLIRKSELIDAFMKRESYVEIYKNPTLKEVDICKDAYYNGFRGVIESMGDVYCWGIDITHNDINLYTKLNIDISNIRFYAEGDIIYVYVSSKQNQSAIKYYFTKYTNIFTDKYKYNIQNFDNIDGNKIYNYEEVINL